MTDNTRNRWHLFSVQILLVLLLTLVTANVVEAQPPVGDESSIHDDNQKHPFSAEPDGPVDDPSSAGSLILLGYRISFNGVTLNPDGTSTWRYTITPSGTAVKALSHWTSGLYIPTYGVVSAGPGGYEVGTDPTTGVTGVKWETQIESNDPSVGFWVTISGLYQVAPVNVAVKAGQNVSTGMIDGPSCEPIEPTPTPSNTPVTPTLTPTHTPVTPTHTPTHTPTTPARYIYGYVYLDGTSQGLPNAVVELKVRWNGSWTSVGSYKTLANGFFEFYYNGPMDMFTLAETNPPGYESTWASKPYPQEKSLARMISGTLTHPWVTWGRMSSTTLWCLGFALAR